MVRVEAEGDGVDAHRECLELRHVHDWYAVLRERFLSVVELEQAERASGDYAVGADGADVPALVLRERVRQVDHMGSDTSARAAAIEFVLIVDARRTACLYDPVPQDWVVRIVDG